MRSIRDVLDGRAFFVSLFGDDAELVDAKKRMLERVWELFRERFPGEARKTLHLISVPNRVEVLGKHTDYQGGETIVLAGPKNFFAVCAAAADGLTELVNADPALGTTRMRLPARGPGPGATEMERSVARTAVPGAATPGTSAPDPIAPELLTEGVGARYALTAAGRLLCNLTGTGCPPLKNVKSVFFSDIPLGGGTSGSSAKLVTDVLTFTSPSGVFRDPVFRSLVRENGGKAGLAFDRADADPFSLSLSMYLAHFENGLDFGDLKGDRGVGTFGGSEDHTAILLGERDRMLFCRFCPTEVLKRLEAPRGLAFVVAFSGVTAEKTGEAMEKYNRLSRDARTAVETLNRLHGTRHSLLRDFYPGIPGERRARTALAELDERPRIADRAFQFFEESDIIHRWVEALGRGDVREIGRLMSRSHDLSRDRLGNIAPEVDALKESAVALGAVGASGFGGGFGGCCYALVPEGDRDAFRRRWRGDYLRRFDRHRGASSFDVYRPCGGCRVEELEGE
jgi:galactokinase